MFRRITGAALAALALAAVIGTSTGSITAGKKFGSVHLAGSSWSKVVPDHRIWWGPAGKKF